MIKKKFEKLICFKLRIEFSVSFILRLKFWKSGVKLVKNTEYFKQNCPFLKRVFHSFLGLFSFSHQMDLFIQSKFQKFSQTDGYSIQNVFWSRKYHFAVFTYDSYLIPTIANHNQWSNHQHDWHKHCSLVDKTGIVENAHSELVNIAFIDAAKTININYKPEYFIFLEYLQV